MSKKQLERKKSKRKEIARKRVIARRKQIRQERKNEEKNRAQFELEYELKNGKIKPFIKEENMEKFKKRDEAILAKIKKNYELLENLEKEYLEKQGITPSDIENYKNIDVEERIKIMNKEGKQPIVFPGEKIKSSYFE